ncbi:MAG: preprotein translocase subunit SecG [Erythrobacter sp.]
MSLFLFLTVVQALVAAALVGVILMQRSEGGGLGIGGSPGGLMGARGAADFLTRSTRWLAIAFVVLSITLAAVAVETTGGDEISTTLDRTVAPAAPIDPLAPAADPLAPAGGAAPVGEAAPAAPATDPLSVPAE